jgi:hypothetical protein
VLDVSGRRYIGVEVMQEISQICGMEHGAILDCGSRIDERRKAQGQDPACKMQDAGSRGRRADDRGQMTDSSWQLTAGSHGLRLEERPSTRSVDELRSSRSDLEVGGKRYSLLDRFLASIL